MGVKIVTIDFHTCTEVLNELATALEELFTWPLLTSHCGLLPCYREPDFVTRLSIVQ